MAGAAGVCSVLSVVLLAFTGPTAPSAMKSIRHEVPSGSLHLVTDTPLPVMREGDVLIKASDIT